MSNNGLAHLTLEQKEAFRDVVGFFSSAGGGMHLLTGYAGTGKTYLVQYIIRYLIRNGIGLTGITAPTNTAVKVVYKKCQIIDEMVEYSTVHSALALNEDIDAFGNIIYIENRFAKPKIKDWKYLIVDEASMLSDDLFNKLDFYVKKGLKILFIGDPIQIPPVNKADSLPFAIDTQRKHLIDISRLTQIVRQSNNSPIIDLTLTIRTALRQYNVFNSYKSIGNVNGNVAFIPSNEENEDRIYNLIKRLYDSDKYNVDMNHVKIIAWQNKTVDYYNGIVREILYGKKLPKILHRERLIMNSPVLENKRVVLSINEEVEVVDFYEDTLDIKIPRDLKKVIKDIKIYDIEVEYTTITDDLDRCMIQLIHEDSEDDFEALLNFYKQKALDEKQGSDSARRHWRKYYATKNSVHYANYSYAITAHKSQGSTYNTAIVADYDIDANNKLIERNRIKYTACSRPSKNLFLLY